MKLYVYEFTYKDMYIQRESSGKIHTTLITVITFGEENKIGHEGKSLVLILHTSDCLIFYNKDAFVYS